MRYPSLPPVGAVAAPELPFRPSPNLSSRHGSAARIVFVHVWGGGSFQSVCNWLSDPRSQASAHVVYGGTLNDPEGEAAQLVKWEDKAWTQCALNPVGLSVESADAIWQGHDAHGFAQLARIVALLCHLQLQVCRELTPAAVLAGSQGFARHADAGALGCGHLSCPTADAELWQQFASRVIEEYRHGGFRSSWGT